MTTNYQGRKRPDTGRLRSQQRAATEVREGNPYRVQACCRPYPLATWRGGVLVSVVTVHNGTRCVGTPGEDVLERYRAASSE